MSSFKPQIYRINLRESKQSSDDCELMSKAWSYTRKNRELTYSQILQFIKDYQFEPYLAKPYKGSDLVKDLEIAEQKIISIGKLIQIGDILIINCWRLNQSSKRRGECYITEGIYYFDGYDLIRMDYCFDNEHIYLPTEIISMLDGKRFKSIDNILEYYSYENTYPLMFGGLEEKDKLE